MDNTNRLELIISVKDDGSVVVDTVKGKIQALGETTKKASEESGSALGTMKAGWLELAAGVTAGYFTIKKGIDVITGLVNVAAEAEQIEKRAAFQIETWGYKFQEVKPYVDAFAESIQRTTRFSSDMTRQGLDQMLQYTSNLEEAMKGVQLAMDITTKKKGMDFGSAVQQVGMAMNGNVEILGRWIPQLRDLESKLGANASEAEKWAYTQGILNKMFGGAALADLKTYAGQLDQLKNQWNGLKKAIGEGLMPSAEEWVMGTKSILMGDSSWIIPTVEKLQKERKNLEDWLRYGIEEGASTKYIEDYKRRIDEVATKIEKLQGASKAAAEAQKKAAEVAKKAAEEAAYIAPPEKDWIKKWVADFDGLTYALDKLGIKSTAVLSKEASDAVRYAEVVKKAFENKEASVRDYINALNVANDAMKKLSGEDLATRREEAWDKNAETIKGISKDEEGWLKKVNKANDDLFKSLKELDKLEVPTHADVAPAEREVQEFIRKLEAQGITLPVRTSGETGGGMAEGGGGTSWTDYVKGDIEFFQGGKKSIDDMSDSFQDFSEQWGQGLDVPISIFGIGSSRKPISEKIREIIGEFGGLEKALSGMEAEINVAELSAEYKKLEAKLNQVERIIPDMSAMASWAGGSPYVGGPIVETVKQLMEEYTSQMKILQMKMGYERLKAYGGSYQGGTQYVPQTGLYTLHEGERVTSKNVSVGGIKIIIESRGDPREMANELIHVLKYRLSGELRDLL